MAPFGPFVLTGLVLLLCGSFRTFLILFGSFCLFWGLTSVWTNNPVPSLLSAGGLIVGTQNYTKTDTHTDIETDTDINRDTKSVTETQAKFHA